MKVTGTQRESVTIEIDEEEILNLAMGVIRTRFGIPEDGYLNPQKTIIMVPDSYQHGSYKDSSLRRASETDIEMFKLLGDLKMIKEIIASEAGR